MHVDGVAAGAVSPSELIMAVDAAALIRYARAFKSGVRERPRDELLDALNAEDRQNHRSFIALRDKHIAHSVNAFEGTSVMALLVPPERGEAAIASLGSEHHSWGSLSKDEILKMKELCGAFREALEALIAEEKRSLLKIVQRMPIDELYALEHRAPDRASMAEVDKRRARQKARARDSALPRG